jgi:hypothetical protein
MFGKPVPLLFRVTSSSEALLNFYENSRHHIFENVTIYNQSRQGLKSRIFQFYFCASPEDNWISIYGNNRKAIPFYATKEYKGRKGITPFILNFGSRWK